MGSAENLPVLQAARPVEDLFEDFLIIVWIELLIGLSRGFLLRPPARSAFPHGAHARLGNDAFHFEMLLVRLSRSGYNRIMRQRQPAALKIFL